MNRQQLMSSSISRNITRMPNFSNNASNPLNMPYFDPTLMYSPHSRPDPRRSQKGFDVSSVQSYNAAEGSLRNSVVSFASGVKKSQRSMISNYPPMLSKELPKRSATNSAAEAEQHSGIIKNNDPKKTNNPPKNVEDKNKKKANYYVDQDYFYSSQFKRNFVKGMLTLAKNKNIQDLSLLLRQLAPTIMVKSEDSSLWVSAYLIIFKIQYKLRRAKPTQQELCELVEDELVDYMLKNQQIKKGRLIKILVYIFKQLPIFKPKVLPWFEDFIKKNKDRLSGINLGRYIDVQTINPYPIDYAALNKSINIKTKQMEKQKQKTQRKQKNQQRNKSDDRVIVINQQEPKVGEDKILQRKSDKPIQSSKQKTQNRNISQSRQLQKLKGKDTPVVEGSELSSIRQRSQIKRSEEVLSRLSITSSKAESKKSANNNNTAQLATGKEQKNQVEKGQQIKLSLQQMIAKRIQSGMMPSTSKNSQNKQIKQANKNNQQKSKAVQPSRERMLEPQLPSQKADPIPEVSNQQFLQSKNEKLKQRIKLLAKNRHEQLKSQQQPNYSLPKPAKQLPNYDFASGYNPFEPYGSSYNQYESASNIEYGNYTKNRKQDGKSLYLDPYQQENYNQQEYNENQNDNQSLGSFVAVENQNLLENYNDNQDYSGDEKQIVNLEQSQNQIEEQEDIEGFDEEYNFED